MSDLRGRPFGWVLLALLAWTGGRLWVPTLGGKEAYPADQKAKSPPISERPSPSLLIATPAVTLRDSAQPIPQVPVASSYSTYSGLPPALNPWRDGSRPSGLPQTSLVEEVSKPQSTGRDTPPTNVLAVAGKAGTPQIRRGWGGNVYAYSFWRLSTGGGGALAPGAQYGGSQSGLIGTIDPFGDPDKGVALMLRGSTTPDGDEREAALGVRWKPASNWPLSLSAERRLRANGPDRFAAYVAGGVDDVQLIDAWKLDAYGQAGYASGRGGGGFFDAQMRVMRPLTEVAGVPFSIGGGGWGGGQRRATRLDIGPSIAATVDTGPAKLLIQLDWRLRVAGAAEPKDGIALTLSSGF